MLRAVVFDLDDTLYPEAEYVKSGFRAVDDFMKNAYGIGGTYGDMTALFAADRADVFGRLLDRYGIDRRDVDKLVEAYRFHTPETLELYPDALPCLEILAARGIKTGIITDGRVEGQKAKIRALGLDRLIDEIVVTDELGGVEYRKPCPRAFEAMRGRLGCEYEETAYVGDNRAKDFAIRAELPVITVEIERADKIHGGEEYARGIEPLYKIKDLTEIKELIDNG